MYMYEYGTRVRHTSEKQYLHAMVDENMAMYPNWLYPELRTASSAFKHRFRVTEN